MAAAICRITNPSRRSSVVHETVYENRFGYTETLKEMGADITLFNQCLGNRQCRFNGHNFAHSLIVRGPTPLTGQLIHIPDLRAGFAYILAALIAKEPSIVTNTHFIDRGYENIEQKLTSLGAKIERVKASSEQQIEEILTPKLSTLV